MNRYFIALPVPRSVRDRLSLLRANLPQARWVDPADYHLTLRFIGECDEMVLNDLCEALNQIETEPFTLQPHGTGTFGHAKTRALWIGVANSKPLNQLQRTIERAAQHVGLAPDGRKFTPHITLARLSRGSPVAVAEALEGLGNPIVSSFTVEGFALYSSGRSRGGGPYVIEEVFPPAHEGE